MEGGYFIGKSPWCIVATVGERVEKKITFFPYKVAQVKGDTLYLTPTDLFPCGRYEFRGITIKREELCPLLRAIEPGFLYIWGMELRKGPDGWTDEDEE